MCYYTRGVLKQRTLTFHRHISTFNYHRLKFVLDTVALSRSTSLSLHVSQKYSYISNESEGLSGFLLLNYKQWAYYVLTKDTFLWVIKFSYHYTWYGNLWQLLERNLVHRLGMVPTVILANVSVGHLNPLEPLIGQTWTPFLSKSLETACHRIINTISFAYDFDSLDKDASTHMTVSRSTILVSVNCSNFPPTSPTNWSDIHKTWISRS